MHLFNDIGCGDQEMLIYRWAIIWVKYHMVLFKANQYINNSRKQRFSFLISSELKELQELHGM